MPTIRELTKMPEGKTLEFKRDISSYEKIVKTVIAFANSAGGKIIIGVEDNGDVVGVDDPLTVEEKLTGIIFNNIVPKILPSIEIATVDGKHLVAIEVYPSGNLPYFYRKLGRKEGVFIRLGSSTRPADQDLINELERFASGIAFDSMPCYDASVDDLDIAYIREQFPDRRQKDGLLLKTLKIAVEEQSRLIPTNGGVILFAKERARFFDSLFVQCARFSGKTKATFIDHIELHEKPIDALREIGVFLKKHAMRGFALDGMRRLDKWNIPLEALREIVVNAIVHADYSVKGVPMRVAVYDDRIEVENPGNFLPGITMEEIVAGTSKIRNPMIMRVFKELGLVEQWGSGVPRVFEQIAGFGLPAPRMEEVSGRVRARVEVDVKSLPTNFIVAVDGNDVGVNDENVGVNDENVGVNGENVGVNGDSVGVNYAINGDDADVCVVPSRSPSIGWMLELMENDARVTYKAMASRLNVTEKTVERNIKKLKALGYIARLGSDKTGSWKVHAIRPKINASPQP